jgi:serine/threonine protein kinase/WD40 repeat protein
METERFQRLAKVFERALELPAHERREFLDRECADQTDFRAEVEGLLRSASSPDDPVVTAAGLDALFAEAGLRPRGDHVSIPAVIGGNSHHTPHGISSGAGPDQAMPVLTGQYRILRVIGEGGMGIVYEAEQSFPKRRVALKSIRPGMFSRRMLRRFQNEAHILGRLQHPGIGQIYEAGTSDPQHADDAFFVMEFVDGAPLTNYAAAKKLGTRARLELMIKVCEAVQHAHQRGVIHRDLKPANILVAENESVAQPKILDFGVARVTDGISPHTGPDSMATSAGQLIGTLAYMSPEQISSESGEADTRADIYALGVTLYQLLTGRLPHDLADKSIPNAAQIVRESEPARVGSLERSFRGDLETIVAKAMEKDRTRRYQSASELGEDLRRFLRGEAVAAKRDSASYVLRKQIKKHRGAFAIGGFVLCCVVAFAVVAGVQSRRNRQLADQLADQLSIANCEHGRLLVRAGSPYMAERTLWTEHFKRPDLPETLWALKEYYSRQPVLASTGGVGIQTREAILTPDDGSGPDSRVLIRAGQGGELQGWSSDLRRCFWRTAGDGSEAYAAAAAPDGSYVVVGGSQGKMRIIDPHTGEILSQISSSVEDSSRLSTLARSTEPPRNIHTIAIAHDGHTMYTGDEAGGLLVWKPEAYGVRGSTWSPVRRHQGSVSGIRYLSISPDDKTLVMTLRQGVYQVWELNDRGEQIVGNLPIRSPGGARPTQFSDDGVWFLALTSEGVVHVFASGEQGGAGGWAPASTIELSDPATTAMLLLQGQGAEQGALVTVGPRGIRVWDLKTRALCAVIPGDESSLGPISRGPRPGTFYSTSMGTAVRLWSIPGGPESPLRELALGDSGRVPWLLSIAPDPTGTWLASSDSSGAIHLFSSAGGKMLGRCDGPSTSGRSVSWRPAGTGRHNSSAPPTRSQFAAAFSGGEIGVFDASGNGPSLNAAWVGHTKDCTATCFSPDGSLLATGALEGDIKLWDADTHRLVRSVPTGQSRVLGISFSPDGRCIASAGIGPGVALYDLSEDRLVASIPDQAQNWRAKFSPDGRLIAATRPGADVQILNAKTLQVIRSLSGHTESVIDLDFDPSGQVLVTGSADRSIRFWSVGTGHSLLTLDSPGEASWVAFVPQSQLVATCGPAGCARLWDLGEFDRRIARSMSYYMARMAPKLGSPPHAGEFLNWGRSVTGDATFSLEDPTKFAEIAPRLVQDHHTHRD